MSKLFAPLTLRGVEIRNRLWVPPMCQYAVEERDGVPTDWHLVHLGALARGGAGAVIAEATGVLPEGRISPQDLGLWNDEQQQAFARIVSFMKSQGATPGIQLAHAGRKASTWADWAIYPDGSLDEDEGGWETVGPSPIAFPNLTPPRELDQAGIDEIVAAFVASAQRAVAAGFELIEIHGAHGYLVHAFLSPLSNLRDDSYGGSLANRARFLLDIVDGVRANIPEELGLLVRVSATDWTDDGLTIEDTVQVVEWLQERGVDLIDVSTGGNALARIPVGPGYQVPFATEIKQRTGMPTATVGMITEPFQAEHILHTGQADVVMVAREMLRDPNFPLRAAKALRVKEPPVPPAYWRAFR